MTIIVKVINEGCSPPKAEGTAAELVAVATHCKQSPTSQIILSVTMSQRLISFKWKSNVLK